MPNTPGPLLQHLPAIYHDPKKNPRLHELLAVFEEILFGPGADGRAGLEQQISRISSLFNPYLHERLAPLEFLPWLAQWVALSQYQGLPERRLRKLIAEIVPLYAQRGTKKYLEKVLQFYIPEDATVTIFDQELPSLIIGGSKVGVDSWLGGDRPFWFLVRIRSRVSTSDPEERWRLKQGFADNARLVIDLAKPAHTIYQLEWELEDSDDNHYSEE